MNAGDTEPTTPMLRAVVYCRATNCRVPKAAPPTSDRNTITLALALSLGRSARICGQATALTSRNTSTQRTNDTVHGGACPAIARATTWLPAQQADATGNRK